MYQVLKNNRQIFEGDYWSCILVKCVCGGRVYYGQFLLQ